MEHAVEYGTRCALYLMYYCTLILLIPCFFNMVWAYIKLCVKNLSMILQVFSQMPFLLHLICTFTIGKRGTHGTWVFVGDCLWYILYINSVYIEHFPWPELTLSKLGCVTA